MRWIAVLCVVAACGGEESKKQDPPQDPPPPVVRNTPPIPDAAPPLEEVRDKVPLFTEEDRKKLEEIQALDLQPQDTPKIGDRPGNGSATGPEPRLKFEASEGDFTALSREEVDRVVKSRKGMIRACYQKELSQVPDLAGKLVVELAIDAGGAVTKANVDVDRSTLHNANVESCVTRQITKLKFPAKGGAIVKYPFIFSAS